MEIAVVDGFRLGRRTRSALLQSTYSVESCVSQNFRSSASVLKRGIGLALLIEPSFLSIHVACGNHPDQSAIASESKSDVQETCLRRLPQRVKSLLVSAVLHVLDNDQGIVEENAFGLGLTNVMFVCALTAIAVVPVKPGNLFKVDHRIC